MTRIGAKPVMAVGLRRDDRRDALVHADPRRTARTATDLLPGYLLVGFALPFTFIPVSIAALAGVEHHEAGLASGLINTAQQIGGAIGVAVTSSVPLSHSTTCSSRGAVPERVHERLAVGVLGVRRRRRRRPRRDADRVRPPRRADVQRPRVRWSTADTARRDEPATAREPATAVLRLPRPAMARGSAFAPADGLRGESPTIHRPGRRHADRAARPHLAGRPRRRSSRSSSS